MWSIEIITGPAEEPISLALAKNHLRVEHTADDALITLWIASARVMTEKHTNRRWVTQTIRLSTNRFPPNGCPLRLPVSPISAVNSVSYIDADGNDVEADDQAWQAWTAHNPPLVAMSGGADWFETEEHRLNAVSIEVTAGYGGASSVPTDAVAAMLLCLGFWYENRGDDARPVVPEHMGLPAGAVRLLAGLNTGGYD